MLSRYLSICDQIYFFFVDIIASKTSVHFVSDLTTRVNFKGTYGDMLSIKHLALTLLMIIVAKNGSHVTESGVHQEIPNMRLRIILKPV